MGRPFALRKGKTGMEEDISRFGLLDDEDIALDVAALEIAALDHPGVALEGYADVLNALTERLVVRGEGAVSAGEQAQALADVVAGAFGFTGDRQTYDDAANADLVRVIERRRGLPVALAIIHVAAARRVGWRAEALNTPGHVLVRIAAPAESVITDPFGGGAIVGAGDLAALLSRMAGRAVVPVAADLTAMTNRQVLVRLLANQATRAEAAGDGARALTLYRRMTLIAPGEPVAWWQRARLEGASGASASAKASLTALLEVTRDPGVRARALAALDAMA